MGTNIINGRIATQARNAKVWRGKHGLLSAGTNAKTSKGDKSYAVAILYLAPADQVEGVHLCLMAEKAGCKAGCLNTAGRGAFDSVQEARERRTRLWRDDKETFISQLAEEIASFEKWCDKQGVIPAVRLNGTSDIEWERTFTQYGQTILDMFPRVQFYDYTKIPKRITRELPGNYHLTLSYSGADEKFSRAVLNAMAKSRTGNVAVVFRSKAARDEAMANGWNGEKVIDGDESDLRFTDPSGVVVGLYAKGRAKKDASGFVIDA